MPDAIVTINAAHDGWITSLISNFERELTGILGTAQARTLAILRDQLTVKDGKIVRSITNTKTLRKFDEIFLQELNRAGYQHLLSEFTSQLPGQLPFFQETLDRLSSAMKAPLPKIQFGPNDLKVFTDQGVSAKDGLDAVVESIAAQAKQRILLSTGGLSFADLAESLATYLHKALPEATGLAETATATYYRIIADRGYQIIQQDLPLLELKYKYYGPLDKLTRPFCAHLEQVNKTYTREQIDEMDNGQIPNVFISCGGWRCRHQWLIALGEESKKPEDKPTPAATKPQEPTPSEIRQSIIKTAGAFEERLNALQTKLFDARTGIADKGDRVAEVNRLNAQISALEKQRDDEVKALLYQSDVAKPKVSFSARPVPKGWVDGVSEFSKLIGPSKVDGLEVAIKGFTGSRANYQPFNSIVKANKDTKASIIVHELGHWLEEAVPEIGRKAREFLVRRTTTNGTRDPLVKMSKFGRGYGSSEVTRPDKFESEYTGKSYGLNGKVYATEIMSMGLQALSERPISFAKRDPDFFEFVLGTIRAK